MDALRECCRQVVVDNPKALVIQHRGTERVWNEDFPRLGGHFRVRPITFTPRHPQANAAMVSFFHTLKGELIGNGVFRTRDEARKAIFTNVEVWYNRQRLHSALGYTAPEEWERLQEAV